MPISTETSGIKSFCIERLHELRKLKPNWDCDSAPVIDRQILNAAEEFVNRLPDHIGFHPMVVPMSSG